MKKVTVIIPVYDESGILSTLRDLIHKAFDHFKELTYEIMFVNDGSGAECSSELSELARSFDKVVVIHLSRNFGQQAAIQAGLSHADGDAVVIMDADMQDSPEALIDFIKAWREGFDVVYAIRTKRKEFFLKKMLFLGFYRLLNMISNIHIPLDAGSFCLVDKKIYKLITQIGDHDRFFPGLRSWVGFKQKGIHVERGLRYDDKPRVSTWGLFRIAKSAIFSFSPIPLMIFYLIAVVSFIAMIALSCNVLYQKYVTNTAILGWTSIIISLCGFGALNSLGIAIVGEYVWRIYQQVLRRPIYIVERIER